MEKIPSEISSYNTLPEVGFIRLKHFLHLLGGMSASAFYQGVRDGRFPPGVKLTKRTVGWPVEVVRETIENLKQNSHD